MSNDIDNHINEMAHAFMIDIIGPDRGKVLRYLALQDPYLFTLKMIRALNEMGAYAYQIGKQDEVARQEKTSS